MKKLLLAGTLGAVIAVAINYTIISIAFRFGWMNGYHAPCLPELSKLINNDIIAVIVQTLLCAVIGFLIGVIFQITNWKEVNH